MKKFILGLLLIIIVLIIVGIIWQISSMDVADGLGVPYFLIFSILFLIALPAGYLLLENKRNKNKVNTELSNANMSESATQEKNQSDKNMQMKNLLNIILGVLLASFCFVMVNIFIGNAGGVVGFMSGGLHGDDGLLSISLKMIFAPSLIIFGYEGIFGGIGAPVVMFLAMIILCVAMYFMYKRNKVPELVFVGFIANTILATLAYLAILFAVLSYTGI